MEEYYEIEYRDLVYKETFEVAVFECCTFINCSMESLKLGESRFVDCRFEECDLSNCNIHGTAFRNVVFMACKMMGLRFDTCNYFGLSVDIRNSVLDYSVFAGVDLKKSKIDGCSLKDVDFTATDLQKIKMTNCTLNGATFDRSNLIGIDLRGTTGIRINPHNNQINKMKISQTELIGLLSDYQLIVD